MADVRYSVLCSVRTPQIRIQYIRIQYIHIQYIHIQHKRSLSTVVYMSMVQTAGWAYASVQITPLQDFGAEKGVCVCGGGGGG